MSEATRMKQQVQDAMDAILVDHDRERVRAAFHPEFVQHNPWAADGGEHVVQMCDFEFGVEMKRWAVQGDVVAYHGFYTAPNPLGDMPLLCVDMWRVQGDRIVEHWDALQPVPQEVADLATAGEGNGLAERSPERVAAQAAAARKLLELGVNGRDTATIDAILADGFTVHLPHAEPGQGKGGFLRWVREAEPTITVKRTVSSGELVFAQCLVSHAKGEQVVYDIFRFDDEGRITDQWLVSQDRVPVADAANPHPHF